MREHKFSDSTVKEIAQKAMHICSNPDCLRFTGYGTSTGKPRACAEGAHVLPAAAKGPRFGEIKDYSKLELTSSANGIWLCTGCHDHVDADPDYYTAGLLFEWKERHEEVIRRISGKDIEAALLELKSVKRFHEEARDFVSFMESKRVLYEGLDHEFPRRVLESLTIIRERIAQTRAKISPDTSLFSHLDAIQAVIHGFLREIGSGTDLDSLKCDSNDPVWSKFSSELLMLRNKIVILLKFISGDADYRLTWMR